MKIIKLTFLLLLIAFVSCSKDDDGGSNIDPNVSIAGPWELVDLNLNNGKMTISSEDASITVSYKMNGKDYDYQAVFTEDPNYVTSTGTFTMEITASAFNETETSEEFVDHQDLEDGILVGEWNIEGNKFILTNDEGEFDYTIKELTENSLKLQIDLSEIELFLDTEDFEGEDGEDIDVEVSGQLNYTFKRN